MMDVRWNILKTQRIERLFKILVMVISFINVPSCLLAQNSRKSWLESHNIARAEVGVKPLQWDKNLESLARKYVNKYIAHCQMAIQQFPHFQEIYGQNLAYTLKVNVTIATAVAKAWVSQKENYDYKSNKCINGDPFSCRAYVQVVWGATTHLGCAKVNCHNKEGTLFTCYYYPGGDMEGKRPYSLH
ncbi:hypothetical protein PIB30_046293 [Stylosanthes scabra]|uniref:SCP domain-containing protein n=1 Tax=Stylosanthes scabra TaxID=79078 RepID=A0ABU6QFX2_9FABA|nr:hypothetical protein [Stylosanthes scabra]